MFNFKSIRQKTGLIFRRKTAESPTGELDQKFLLRVRGLRPLPSWQQLKYLHKFYSHQEILLSKLALFFILISALVLGINFYFNNLEKTPAVGGQYAEAIVGAPTYINPLFSQTNDADQDLVNLVFSGLVKVDESGKILPDLAESYSLNEAGTAYAFKLRTDALWHDGEAVTADDVVFTAQSIKDQNFKSPLQSTFRNVEVKKTDDYNVQFTLPEPFAPFLSVFTFGVLPEHLWQDIDPAHAILADLNLRPIGSGPYQFSSFVKDKKGNIREYRLERFPDYYGGGPFVKKISLKFFDSFEEASAALEDGNADGLGLLPHGGELLRESQYQKIYRFALPQYTAIFFNKDSNAALTDNKVRAALALATSREKIINAAFSPGSAEPAYSAIPATFSEIYPASEGQIYDPALSGQLLDEAGWQRVWPEGQGEENNGNGDNTALGLGESEVKKYTRVKTVRRDGQDSKETLTINLTAVQRPESVKVAEETKRLWEQIGVQVNLQIIELGKIQKDIIKPRAFEALLFGQILGRDPDPYPFWHSSQANDPGINLSRYANRDADKLLEEARRSVNQEIRQKNYLEFQKKLSEDIPAIFLYSLNYIYILPDEIKGNQTQIIHKTSDRFAGVNKWFIKTKRTFKFD